MADSSIHPGIQWVHRFYRNWRKDSFGAENGKSLFDQLEHEVIEFNQHNDEFRGKVVFQKYSGSTTQDSSSSSAESFQEEPKLKESKKLKPSQPLILAICTPLMSSVHRYVQQSRELIFCDSTSSLDTFNNSFFILSIAHPAGGSCIGVMLTSDEKESTRVLFDVAQKN